ncbi:MAG TPA: UMP kinase [Anaerolineae bacterium]|nr:UMP kinase [Anaerolineae bacterium]
MAAQYRRILLKLGGEALAGPDGTGVDPQRALEVAAKIKQLRDRDVEMAIVIGAGNLWRGVIGLEYGMDRATADQMGMIATVMNALALRDALEQLGMITRVQTAIEMRQIAEPYIRLRAIRHLEKGYVVVMGGGTGNPYFTTDTAGALRAIEIHAEVLVKATKVDGVYDKDPMQHPNARRFDHLTYMQALNMQVKVMDATAITTCMDNDLPIQVINLWDEDALVRLVMGEPVGTLISH